MGIFARGRGCVGGARGSTIRRTWSRCTSAPLQTSGIVQVTEPRVGKGRVRVRDQRRRGVVAALVGMVHGNQRAIGRLDDFWRRIGLDLQQAIKVAPVGNSGQGGRDPVEWRRAVRRDASVDIRHPADEWALACDTSAIVPTGLARRAPAPNSGELWFDTPSRDGFVQAERWPVVVTIPHTSHGLTTLLDMATVRGENERCSHAHFLQPAPSRASDACCCLLSFPPVVRQRHRVQTQQTLTTKRDDCRPVLDSIRQVLKVVLATFR